MVIKSIEQFTISDCCALLGLNSRHPEEGLKKIQPFGSRREIVERLLGLLEYVRRTLSIESVDSYLENIEEMDFIDIGLSFQWAKYNCGAHSELEYGDCFSWGEISPKEKFGKKYYTLSKKNRWKADEYYDIGNEISATSYDSVAWRYGLDCKMPFMLDFSELLFKCKWEFQIGDKMKPYYKIIGSNGNCIFLPFAPLDNRKIFEDGLSLYWCGAISPKSASFAYGLWLSDISEYHIREFEIRERERYEGGYIRPVLRNGMKVM